MDTKKDYKFAFLKSCFILFAVVISVFLCVVIIPGIDKGEIMTLSASQSQPNQVNQTDTSPSGHTPTNESVQPGQKQANKSVSIVTEAAVKLGVLSCVSRINQVASFLTAGNQSGIFIFKPKNQPDQHIFSTSFELVRSDESTIYASASFFPNQDAVYDTVEYTDTGCEELEKTVFKNLKRIAVIKKNIVVLDGGAVKVFLMPAGSGSIVIKKEVIR